MRTYLYVANRYSFTKNRQNVINIISIISVGVLVIGTASLFIVLSAFGGLRQVSLSFINSSNADLILSPKASKYFHIGSEQYKQLSNVDGILSFTKVVEERAYLNYKDKNYIAYIKGIDSIYSKVVPIAENTQIGKWIVKGHNAVVGDGIARSLGTGVFDTNNFLQVIVPRVGVENIVSVSKLPYHQLYFKVVGIYSINENFDKKYVYVDIKQAQNILELEHNEISAIEIRLDKKSNEVQIRKQLKAMFGDDFKIRNRSQQNVSIYKMLNMEKAAIYLIFVLVLIVAMFNLAGAIVMTIIEKKKDLRVLYVMGMTIKELRKIFLSQGLIITVSSAVLGLLLGFVICLLQVKYSLIDIAHSQPYPLKMSISDAFSVMLIVIIIGFLVSWFASVRISRKMLS